ncbi:hypothetical protein Lgee_1473 [Legionella geestiana]|uniref:Uncharacterized protein n=1 Tax=Legionella geestiana TaxID=45065 RepID=A0A0W0TTI9_9GAMM|nr:hypothetical protein Lgee_1473 [Legionella geestiana]STX54733.1 Uncharacterised protein [Legionella geestiana]
MAGSALSNFNEAYSVIKKKVDVDAIKLYRQKTSLPRLDKTDERIQNLLKAIKFLLEDKERTQTLLNHVIYRGSKRIRLIVDGYINETMTDFDALTILHSLQEHLEFFNNLEQVLKPFVPPDTPSAASSSREERPESHYGPDIINALSAVKRITASEETCNKFINLPVYTGSRRIQDIVSGFKNKTMTNEQALTILNSLKTDNREFFARLVTELNTTLAPVSPAAPSAASSSVDEQPKSFYGPDIINVLSAVKRITANEETCNRFINLPVYKGSKRIQSIVSGFKKKTMTNEQALTILDSLKKDNTEFFARLVAELTTHIAPVPHAAPSAASSSRDERTEVSNYHIFQSLASMVANRNYKLLNQSIREHATVSNIIDRLEDMEPFRRIEPLLNTVEPDVYRSLLEACNIMCPTPKAPPAGFFVPRAMRRISPDDIQALHHCLTTNRILKQGYAVYSKNSYFSPVFCQISSGEVSISDKINALQHHIRTFKLDDINNNDLTVFKEFLSLTTTIMSDAIRETGIKLSWKEFCTEMVNKEGDQPQDGIWQLAVAYGASDLYIDSDLPSAPSFRT